jgi:hypothetical protein
MTTDRAYRKALPHVIACGEMEAVAAPNSTSADFSLRRFRAVVPSRRKARSP